MEKKKVYVKPPIKTMCVQAAFLLYCIVMVNQHFDGTIFGMPLESFLLMWCPYLLFICATGLFIYRNKDRRD